MQWPFGTLRPLAGYDLIVANPPLPFSIYSAKGEGKSYQRMHGAMPLEEIKALPVGHLVRSDCLLVLSSTPPMLDVSMEVLKAWGFLFKSEIVCRKLTKHGKLHRGTGYRIRSMHRSFLLGVLGSPRHKPIPSCFDGTFLKRGAIPDELFKLLAEHMPHAWRLELFAEGRRGGWTTHSLEKGKAEPVVHQDAQPLHETGPALHIAEPRAA